jgi:hypothetical protein
MKLAINRMGNAVLNPLFLHKLVGNFSFMSIWVGVNIIGINLEGQLCGSGAAANIGLCNQCSIIGAQTRGTMNWSRRGKQKNFYKFFTIPAFKRAVYAKHTININPSFYPLVLHSKRVGKLSFLFWVRVDSNAGINLVGLLLHVVIHGGIAIKVCISNCKIDFC